MDEYLTEKEVADMLKISMSKLRLDRQNGTGIPYIKLGASVRYRRADVTAYLEKRTVETE